MHSSPAGRQISLTSVSRERTCGVSNSPELGDGDQENVHSIPALAAHDAMKNLDDTPRDHLFNRIRSALYFGLRYPWVRHGRNVHVKWSTVMWSPHQHIVIGDDVGIGFRCVLHCDIEIGSKVLIAAHVALVGSDDHR